MKVRRNHYKRWRVRSNRSKNGIREIFRTLNKGAEQTKTEETVKNSTSDVVKSQNPTEIDRQRYILHERVRSSAYVLSVLKSRESESDFNSALDELIQFEIEHWEH